MDNVTDIPQVLADLAAAVRDKSMVSCAFVPLDQARAGEHGPEIWRAIVAAGELIEKAGFRCDRMGGLDTAFRVHHCMMDEAGGGVLIAPDGRLFPCLQCPEGSSYGNVFDGVTDEAALREFTSLGKLPAECANCAFLPDCTAFSHCPIKDFSCAKVRRLRALPTLHELVQRAEEGAEPFREEDAPVE
jgi:radical SAM protein with 4Fe4S-binding SPASM domain